MDVLPKTYPNPDNNVMKLLGEYVEWTVTTVVANFPTHLGSILMKRKLANGVTEYLFYFDGIEFDSLKTHAVTELTDQLYVCDGAIVAKPTFLKNVVMMDDMYRRYGYYTYATTPAVEIPSTVEISGTIDATTKQFGLDFWFEKAQTISGEATNHPVKPFFYRVVCMDE